jgi:hypothetical protein
MKTESTLSLLAGPVEDIVVDWKLWQESYSQEYLCTLFHYLYSFQKIYLYWDPAYYGEFRISSASRALLGHAVSSSKLAFDV